MEQDPNAKLTPKGRETLVSRIESGRGVAEAARQMGISRQTACKRPRGRMTGELRRRVPASIWILFYRQSAQESYVGLAGGLFA